MLNNTKAVGSCIRTARYLCVSWVSCRYYTL